MLSFQTIFVITVALTAGSGIAAAGIAVFGDTRRNLGRRAVAKKFARIGLIGAMAIVLRSPELQAHKVVNRLRLDDDLWQPNPVRSKMKHSGGATSKRGPL